MLKKLLILFLSANLCASENIENPELSKSDNSSAKIVGLSVAVFLVHTVIPNILNASSPLNAKSIDELVMVSRLAVGAYSLTQLYKIGKDIYASRNPSESQRASIAEADEKINLLTAKRKLRTCLMTNTDTPRNDLGRPDTCENLAQMFSMLAGKSELDEMTTTFNETYRN